LRLVALSGHRGDVGHMNQFVGVVPLGDRVEHVASHQEHQGVAGALRL
jgi:hypothetical protein